MTILLKGGRLFLGRRFVTADILLKGGSAFVFDEGAAPDIAHCDAFGNITADEVIDLSGKDILPGFADVHVHFREPGFSYKETIRTGSLAAAHGGHPADVGVQAHAVGVRGIRAHGERDTLH